MGRRPSTTLNRRWHRELLAIAVGTIAVGVAGFVFRAGHNVAGLALTPGLDRITNLWPATTFLGIGLALFAVRRRDDAERSKRRESVAWEELRLAEERFRGLLDLSPSPLFVVSGDADVLFMNTSARDTFGVDDLEEAIGTSLLDRVEGEREALLDLIMSCGDEADASRSVPFRFVGAESGDLRVRVHASPLRFDGTDAILVVTMDDSHRQREEEAVRRYELLSQYTTDVILFTTPSGDIIDCNAAAERTYGYPREDLLHLRVSDLTAEEARGDLSGRLEEADLCGIRFETKHARGDGTPFEVECWGQGATFSGKRLLVLTVRDVGARCAFERALRESERRYRQLVDMAPLPIIVHQNDRIVFANAAMAQLMRVRSADALIGLNALDIVHADGRPVVQARYRDLLNGGPPTPSIERRLVRPEGSLVETEACAVGVMFDDQPAVQVVFKDLTERKTLERGLRDAMHQTAAAMARLIETRDPYTHGHQERVARIARALATELSLDEELAEAIELAASIHDIGKINTPIEILSKPGNLCDAEMELVKAHPRQGASVLEPIGFPWHIAEMVLQHHERLDGSGYPQGLAGDEILLGARVIAVSDVLEAVASHRPYRPARGVTEALRLLEEGKGTKFDAQVVEACLHLFECGPEDFGLPK